MIRCNDKEFKDLVAFLEYIINEGVPPELYLSYNKLGPEEAEVLAEVLSGSDITKLSLKASNIGPAGARALATGLPRTLKVLDLSDNELGHEGARDLARRLPRTHTTTLNLSHNSIGARGSEILAQVLYTSTKLTELHLSNNELGHEGAKAIAKALPGSNITTLDLSSNDIGEEGAAAIAKVLPGSNITTLDLSSNDIGEEGAAAIAEVLAGSNITTLDLSDSISSELLQRINLILTENQKHKIDLRMKCATQLFSQPDPEDADTQQQYCKELSTALEQMNFSEVIKSLDQHKLHSSSARSFAQYLSLSNTLSLEEIVTAIENALPDPGSSLRSKIFQNLHESLTLPLDHKSLPSCEYVKEHPWLASFILESCQHLLDSSDDLMSYCVKLGGIALGGTE